MSPATPSYLDAERCNLVTGLICTTGSRTSAPAQIVIRAFGGSPAAEPENPCREIESYASEQPLCVQSYSINSHHNLLLAIGNSNLSMTACASCLSSLPDELAGSGADWQHTTRGTLYPDKPANLQKLRSCSCHASAGCFSTARSCTSAATWGRKFVPLALSVLTFNADATVQK